MAQVDDNISAVASGKETWVGILDDGNPSTSSLCDALSERLGPTDVVREEGDVVVLAVFSGVASLETRLQITRNASWLQGRTRVGSMASDALGFEAVRTLSQAFKGELHRLTETEENGEPRTSTETFLTQASAPTQMQVFRLALSRSLGPEASNAFMMALGKAESPVDTLRDVIESFEALVREMDRETAPLPGM